MKPSDTDIDHRQQKHHAVRGAAVFGVGQGLSALLFLWLRGQFQPQWMKTLLLVLAIGHLTALIPTLVALKQRLKEIEGGELDAARKY